MGDGSQKKIVIDSIDADSPVDYSSLKEGDVILEINGMPVTDAKQVSKLIRGSNRRQEVYVLRNTDLYIFLLKFLFISLLKYHAIPFRYFVCFGKIIICAANS